MNFKEALDIYQNMPLSDLMAEAHRVRLTAPTHASPVVTWQIDRNINTTNVCVGACKFCAFSCRLSQRDVSFITSMDEYREKIAETLALGGDQILLQGGMNPTMDLEFYEELFSTIKGEFPSVKLHALGPAEVWFLAKKAKIGVRETLERLLASGMTSLPGAGAEILDDQWRARYSPGKCSATEWIEVMRTAQSMGILTSATMMYGFNDSDSLRIKHLMEARDLQSEYGGFMAFIPWPYQGPGVGVDMSEYLRMIAISRIVLTNVPNIQASWLTVGPSTAQMALHGGANDLGSIMIEENVVRSAGCAPRLNGRDWLCDLIREAGFVPAQRNQAYELCPPI